MARPTQAFGDGEGVGAGLDDQNVIIGRVTSSPGAQSLKGLTRYTVYDAGIQWIASAQDGGGEGIGMNVEANRAAFGSECWRCSRGLRWWRINHSFGLL